MATTAAAARRERRVSAPVNPGGQPSRDHARALAIFDLALWTLGLVLFIIYAALLCFEGLVVAQFTAKQGGNRRRKKRKPEVPPIDWPETLLGIYLELVLGVVHFITTMGLYRATDPRTPVHDAIHNSKHYRLHQIIFAIVEIILPIVDHFRGAKVDFSGVDVFFFAMRLASLFIAHQFIVDLEQRQEQEENRQRQPEVAPAANLETRAA